MRFSLSLLPALVAAPALAEPPRVVVDIAPVHALVAQVMDGISAPELLLDQDANPHAVQLRPSQARMLAEADLVIWVGPELSPWLGRVVESGDTENIALMALPATVLRDFGAGHAAEAEGQGDADHDHEAEGHADADHAEVDHTDGDHADATDVDPLHEGHSHTGTDPHVWLTPDNARAWLGVFAETFAKRDPGNAAAYRANADAAGARLDALVAGIENRLAPHRGAEIVTFHDSFGYFADRFDLEIAGSVRSGDAAAPSTAAIAALKGLVAGHDIACAFAEPAFDPGLLDAVAAGTGLRIGTLDPTGVLQPTGPAHYEATLGAVAETIAACLEGAAGGGGVQ